MAQHNRYPELIVAVASAAWGLFWIPLRAFEQRGLEAGWAVLMQFAVPLVVLLPFAVQRWRSGQPSGAGHYRSGVFVGLAVSMYLESLLLTDVARSLILFYVMPAWGTLLEIGWLGRSLTRWRIISLLLSVAGLLIIIGGGAFGLAMNAGDVMALLAGMLFAIGAVQVRNSAETETTFSQLFAFFFYGTIAATVLSLLPLAEIGHPPSTDQLLSLAPWLLLASVGFLIPVMWGIYWGSRHVDPGRLGIILQVEAIVGIGSAALFAGEPFGVRQAVGAILVVAAGITEVVGNRQNG